MLRLPRVAGLVVGVLGLWAVFSSRWKDRRLSRSIGWALRRRTHLEVRDCVSLLHLAGEYGVIELEVNAGDWLAGRALAELDLRSEGVLVLGIERADGSYVGVPRGPTRIARGDTPIAYGRADLLDDLNRRPAGGVGDPAHAGAVGRQRRLVGLPAEVREGAAVP